MEGLNNFFVAFIFSFLGSIPPGTINLTIVELGLAHKLTLAFRLALAASIIEYPYAWIAVKFEKLFTSSAVITDNLHLIAAIVMILLGTISIWPAKKKSRIKLRFEESGFRRGIMLGVLNPLAIPYWVGITAYLRSQQWIDLSSQGPLHAYLLGVCIGAFALLVFLAYLSKKAMSGFNDFPWIRKVPGYLLLLLGFYALFQYAF